MMTATMFPRWFAATALVLCAACASQEHTMTESVAPASAFQPHYLEIVTDDVEATCSALAASRSVEFGDPQPDLGGARTAPLAGGGLVGVRAPMHAKENSVVRPYFLTDDIDSAVEAAVAAGGTVLLPPTAIEGRGTFAIYMLGGIEHGLWLL